MFIPSELKSVKRWITWRKQNEHKIPTTKINDPHSFMEYETAEKSRPYNGGVGFVFTDEDDIGGIDLDACRNPDTGKLAPWATEIVDFFNSYTEVSPSGTGVKIFAKGAPPKIGVHVLSIEGMWEGKKRPQIEIYVSGRYFCVTGEHLEGTPKEVASRPEAWDKIISRVNCGQTFLPKNDDNGEISSGGRNITLASLAGSMRRRGMDNESILAALEIENRVKCKPPLGHDELVTIVNSVGKYDASPVGFERDTKNNIKPNKLINIRLAIERLGVDIKFNAFTSIILINTTNGTYANFDDHQLAKLWFEIYEKFEFRPNKDTTYDAVTVIAMENQFHPVQDYFSSLKWDGVKRIDTWLHDFAGVEDSEYSRTIGALVLCAGVKRISHPGVKFDEMLVLETPDQGTDKSSAIRALCPDETWFTDDLPLNADSKEVIELTSGKWIIEASELSGMKKGDIETLKGFLSRQVDQARLAYGRITTMKPRNFIVIGTTNNNSYLKDPTGNRRFWPVRIARFDTARLKADRDQLWAEAVERATLMKEKDLRLPYHLWAVAKKEQDDRLIVDPWESLIEEALGEVKGRLLAMDVWLIIGITDPARRSPGEGARIGSIMQRLGFRSKRMRVDNKPKWLYCRGESEEFIKLLVNDQGIYADIVKPTKEKPTVPTLEK